MKLLFKLALVLLILIGFLVVRTVVVEFGANQKEFLAGKVPDPKPDGFYKGSVRFYQGGWKGKTFHTRTGTGVNMIGDPPVPQYPFKTSVAKGVRDTALDVYRIDYRVKGNPSWVRSIVDEIVQVAPGKYLGKIHFTAIPGFPVSLGFFRLERP